MLVLTETELNFDEYKSGSLHENHELENHLIICLETRENKKILLRDIRSRDLIEAY
jgi:hypothetical protein